jgi:hypothetical protein
VWSVDEARRFLESARHNQDPFYSAYVLILVLGLRKGEVLGPAAAGLMSRSRMSSPVAVVPRKGGLRELERQPGTKDSEFFLPNRVLPSLG